MVAAFLNYIFHPMLGRLLSPTEFGDIQALLSLVAQSAIIFGAFSIIAVNITTNTSDLTLRDAIITELQKIAFWFVGAVFVFLLFSVSFLKSFFNFSSIYSVIALAVILPISSLTTFRNAHLQGTGKFKELSVSGVISSISRLVLSVGLVLLGFGAGGAITGIVVANIVVLVYLFYKTRNSFKLDFKASIHELEKGSVRSELVYGLLILFATSLVTLYYTSDVLIIKHYYNASEAGLYSGISAIAKILFFAIGPTSAVLLSSVKIKNTFNENSKVLMKSVLISLALGLAGLLGFYFMKDLVIRIMIGERYLAFAHYLPKAGLVMLLSAFTNIFIFYFLALRRFFLIPVSIIGISVLYSIYFFNHSSIDSVLNGLSLSLMFVLLLLVSMYAKDYFSSSSNI
jgi:O-antigen/teichoic acid export membrane protein